MPSLFYYSVDAFFHHVLLQLVVVAILLIRSGMPVAVSAHPLQFQLDGPQACPQNPIRLRAHRFAQFIYSPYTEQRLYPPDTDCQFLIEASSPQHRIQLVVVDSELEEPLFTECNDYVSVRDREGNETSAKEVVRWCGQDYPAAMSSSSDSLLVHFHSDSVIQKRGFNISVVEYGWDFDHSLPYCYKQFVLPHILPWVEAQKECNYERANLATFQSERDYAYIAEVYSQTHSFPWIGYSDASVEGTFETADRSTPLWPENFPLRQENEMKDCVFLDWNRRDQVAYEIDDCRNRRPFLCKKKKDGSDVPVVLSAGMIRRGFRDFSIDYTILIVVLVALAMLLVVACVVWHKFKERAGGGNRVGNADMNQRLVGQGSGQLQPGQGSQGSGLGGSRHLLGGSSSKAQLKAASAQKAAAAVALAKAKEREKQYAKNSVPAGAAAAAARPPLESQESVGSFPPLHQAPPQIFAASGHATASAMMESFQMRAPRGRTVDELEREQAAAGSAGGDSDDAAQGQGQQSPRIRLSPNQPEPEEEEEPEAEQREAERRRQRRKEEAEKEDEEEENERHNRGYEPDSEEGGDEDTARGRSKRANAEKEAEQKPEQMAENGGGGTEERVSLHGEFARREGSMDAMPVRPDIVVPTAMRRKERKAEAERRESEALEGRADEGEAEAEKEAEVQNDAGTHGTVPGGHEEREPETVAGGDEREPQAAVGQMSQQPPHANGLAAVREDTMFSAGQQTLGSSGTSMRLRARRKSFDKPPPVGPLDNVSAISLDEFWQKDG